MKTRGQDFALGLTAIALGALFVATILFLYPSIGRPTYRIQVLFPHDDGMAPLKRGSAVLLGGAYQIGEVVDVSARTMEVEDHGARGPRLTIIVDAEIDEDISLGRDCRITTDAPAVGGAGFMVVLDVGTPGTPILPGQPLRGLPPQSLAAAIGSLSRQLLAPGGLIDKLNQAVDSNVAGSLMNKLVASLSDVNAITGELRGQMSATERTALLAKLHQIMDELGQMTAGLRAQLQNDPAGSNLLSKLFGVLDRLGEAVGEATALLRDNRPALTRTIQNVESISQTLNAEVLAALRGELNRDDPATLLGKLHGGLDRVNSSLANVQAVSESGRSLLVLNKPALDRTLANFKDTSENLRLASEEIRLAPWRLLYRPTPQESQELGVFEAARTFAEAATYLDDAAARLEAAAAAAAPGQPSREAQEELRAIHASVRSAFERFQKAEQFLYEQLK